MLTYIHTYIHTHIHTICMICMYMNMEIKTMWCWIRNSLMYRPLPANNCLTIYNKTITLKAKNKNNNNNSNNNMKNCSFFNVKKVAIFDVFTGFLTTSGISTLFAKVMPDARGWFVLHALHRIRKWIRLSKWEK